MIALKRIFGMLKNSGKFFLKDTVYSFDENTYEAFFNNLINIIRKAGGTQIANDLEIGIRDEYSTPGWIMEALLLRAGFTINEVTIQILLFSVKPANTGNDTLQLLWNQFSEKSIYINIITGILS